MELVTVLIIHKTQQNKEKAGEQHDLRIPSQFSTKTVAFKANKLYVSCTPTKLVQQFSFKGLLYYYQTIYRKTEQQRERCAKPS